MRPPRLLIALVAVLAYPVVGSARAAAVPCHVVIDAAGDAGTAVGPTKTPNDPALDVVSADIGIGATTVVLVIRVADLGSALAQGPQAKRWDMNFELRGHAFATSATRALDGADFRVLGDFPEQNNAAPGAQTSLPVAGSFDETRNEITVVVPRRLLPVLRPNKDSVTNLAVASFVGAGITTERVSVATTVDQTAQPGPALRVTAKTCVRAA